jgi:hypothetical protein
MRLDDSIARPSELLGQEAQENVLDAWMASLQEHEVVADNGASLRVLECRDCGRPSSTRQEEKRFAILLPAQIR